MSRALSLGARRLELLSANPTRRVGGRAERGITAAVVPLPASEPARAMAAAVPWGRARGSGATRALGLRRVHPYTREM
eukprot:4823872-Prymnesium_polylepis.1